MSETGDARRFGVAVLFATDLLFFAAAFFAYLAPGVDSPVAELVSPLLPLATIACLVAATLLHRAGAPLLAPFTCVAIATALLPLTMGHAWERGLTTHLGRPGVFFHTIVVLLGVHCVALAVAHVVAMARRRRRFAGQFSGFCALLAALVYLLLYLP